MSLNSISSSLPEYLVSQLGLPRDICLVAMEIESHVHELFPIEANYIRDAVKSRIMEFSTGRVCARAALSALGMPASEIPIGRMRNPIWPEGIAGSISHDGCYCISSVAWKSKISGVGIDLVKVRKLERDSIGLICSASELNSANTRCGYTVMEAALIIFSIKESLFKCLYPLFWRMIDFKDVTVELSCENLTATVNLVGGISREVANINLQIKYIKSNDWIVSAAWIEP